MLAPVGRVRAPLGEALGLELVDDCDHRARVDQRPGDQLLLRAAGMALDQGHDAEVGRAQAERLERLSEHRGGPLPVPGQEEAGGACQWLGGTILETHVPECYLTHYRSFVI